MKRKEFLFIIFTLMLTFVLPGCTSSDTNLKNELETKKTN